MSTHPGKAIKEIYIDNLGFSARDIAAKLDVAPSTFNNILLGHANISPAMALRLSKCLGSSPESWLLMQMQYDLKIARLNVDLDQVERINILQHSKKSTT